MLVLVAPASEGNVGFTLYLCLFQGTRSSGNVQNENEEGHDHQAELIHLVRVVVMLVGGGMLLVRLYPSPAVENLMAF